MKIRDQNYSQETAALLRDISMYRALLEGQLLQLYPGKQAIIRKLLAYMSKQHRIVYEDGLYFPAPGRPDHIDFGLLAAVWVLVDFIDRVEYHSVGDFPAKLIFIADSEVYEVVHMEAGREALLSQVMGRKEEKPSHYLVLVDSPEQINGLELPNVCGYCTVAPNGTVEYYQKE